MSSNIERNYRPKIVFDSQQTTGSGTIPPATTDVAEGAPAGILQDLSTNPDRSLGIHASQFNFFFHGDWAIRSNFHLNLGLRWELISPRVLPITNSRTPSIQINYLAWPPSLRILAHRCRSIFLPPTIPRGLEARRQQGARRPAITW